MTLSRHTQVENLTSLLGARRSESRQRTRRQAAYLNLIGAILDRPSTDIGLSSSIATLPGRVVSLAGQSQAA